MSLMAPFTPGPTVSQSSAGASAQVQLGKPGAIAGGQQVMVTNPAGGTQTTAFIKFGSDATVTAAATDTPILPGTQVILTVPANATNVAVFASAATLVYFTSGIGE